MTQNWTSISVSDVRAGDTIRLRGSEFEVARVDAPFLGRPEMVCFVEDTPQRWHAYPARLADAVDVLR